MLVSTGTSNLISKDRAYFKLKSDSACYVLYADRPFGTGDVQHVEAGRGIFISNPWRSGEHYYCIDSNYGKSLNDLLFEENDQKVIE